MFRPVKRLEFGCIPNATLSDDQFKERIYLGNLGTIHFLVNGKEIAVPVG